MDYDELFTFEHLYEAHRKARRCKRCKKDVILFELNLSENLWDVYDALRDRTYTVGGYNNFTIHEPKQREIQALCYRDRVVQHVLCDLYLYPLLTRRLIYDNGACQKGKGTDFALNRLTHFLSDFYKHYGTTGYMLKADIRHFFPTVDHGVLKQKIRRAVNEPEILVLLDQIIDSYNGETGKGIPMGNQTSQLFALYYLDQMDRLVKERLHVKYYLRYMDDCILIHEDKAFLKHCLNKMRELVEDELLLEFNQKTQIFPIRNGVDFLGFHFYMTDTGKVIRKVRQSTKKRYKKRMKKLRLDYNAGRIELEDVKKTLPGFYGHLKRGHTYRLQKAVHRDFVLIQSNKEEKE